MNFSQAFAVSNVSMKCKIRLSRAATAVAIFSAGQFLVMPQGASAGPLIEWKVGDGGNGHFYGISTLRSGWSEVESEAVTLGGHLVSINSAAEQLFIENTFLIPEPTHLSNEQPNIFWIGLWDGDINNIGDPTNFSWSDGSPLTYTNWAPLEPSNTSSNEDAVVINWDQDNTVYDPYEYGRWNDIDIPFVLRPDRFNGAFGIMEFVPEPTTIALLSFGICGLSLKRTNRNQ